MILVGNGFLITVDANQTCYENGCVVIEHGLICGVGETSILRELFPKAEFIDAKGGVIMPGLINTHHHIYSTYARGMSLPNYSPKSFTDILKGLWWKLDSKLTLEDVYYSTMFTYIDCIKSGVTTVFDHHASYGAIKGSLKTIADVSASFGLRSCLCFEISDRNGEKSMKEAVEESVSFLRSIDKKDDTIKGMMGLHASFTLSPKTLSYVRECTPEHVGFHIHVAEGEEDVKDSLSTYHTRVVNRLYDEGILGPKTIAAHCVHIDEKEMEILASTSTKVVFNPESNMANVVGCPDVLAMLQNNIIVGLGTDGYTSDLFESLKVANVLLKHEAKDTNIAFDETNLMLFQNNHLIADTYFNSTIGRLEEGAVADVIVLDYKGPTPITKNNYKSHILYGFHQGIVTHTIVDGKVLMKDRILLSIDEKAVMDDVKRQACDFWKRMN